MFKFNLVIMKHWLYHSFVIIYCLCGVSNIN